MRKTFALFCVGTLMSCSAMKLDSGAQQVKIVTNEPQSCEYLGEITGSQGDFFTGAFTSNADLETGARNDMKNRAYKREHCPNAHESCRTDRQHGPRKRQYGADKCDVYRSCLQMSSRTALVLSQQELRH